MATTEADNKNLVRESLEAFNERDKAAFSELHTEDVVAHTSLGGMQSIEAVTDDMWDMFEAFPDLTFTIEDMLAEGDRVAARYSVIGTHEGEFQGIEPTGEEVEFPNIGTFRIDDGEIAEVWIVSDRLSLMRQLGIVEPPTEQMATTETILQQRLEEVGSVLASGDAERIGALYTQEGQLLPPGSDFVTGREAVAEFWQGVGEMGVETIDIDPIEVEAHESTARRVGHATLADADGVTIDQVKFIEIWKREDGEWRIHRDIWNSNISDEE